MFLLPPILILAVMYCAKLAQAGFRIDAARITDTDTMMRLAYLREILAHGWQDGYFGRDNAPYGSFLHWTEPFYYLIIGLYEAFRTVLPPDRALIYAGYFTGPLLAFLATLAAYWAMRVLVTKPLAMASTFAIVLSNSFFVYNKLGAANHHTLLLIDFMLVAGCAIRAALKPRDAVIASALGLAAAFAVWTSFEMLVLAGIVFGFLFLLWIWDGAARTRQVLAAATAFSLLTTISVLIDPPLGGYRALAFDHPSLPVLVLAAIPLAIALSLRVVHPAAWQVRLAYLAAASVIGLSAWGWLFLVRLSPVMQHMDPAVATEMNPTLAEWVSIHRLWSVLAVLGNGIAGIVASALLLPRNRYYVPVLVFMMVLGVAAREYLRFAGYFWVAGTFVATYCLQRVYASGAKGSPGVARTLGVALAGFVLIAFCQAAGTILLNREDPDWQAKAKSCSIADVAPALNDAAWLGVPQGSNPIFANDFQQTPDLLFRTGVRTIAGYYHRDVPGVADLLSLFRDAAPGDPLARGLIQDRGVGFVMVCPGASDFNFAAQSLALYRKQIQRGAPYGKPTLYTRLSNGQPPGWLTPLPWPAGVKSDLELYRVNGKIDGRLD